MSNNCIDTSFEDPQTEADIISELQTNIAALETKLANCQEKHCEAEENAGLVGRQFPLKKINDDNGICINLYQDDRLILLWAQRLILISLSRACAKKHASGICATPIHKNTIRLYWVVYSATFSYVGSGRNMAWLETPQCMEIPCWCNYKWSSDFLIWPWGGQRHQNREIPSSNYTTKTIPFRARLDAE